MITETAMTLPVTTASYVTYYFAGVFMSEESCKPIASRNEQTAAKFAPDGAFAFTFHDRVETTVSIGGRDIALTSKAINASGRYYINAEHLTASDVEAMGPDFRTLLANMRSNRWDAMLRCRTGNYQPLREGDSVIWV